MGRPVYLYMKVEGNDSYQGLAEDGGGENMEVAQEDLYQVCGVTKEATPTELKKSYRKLALKCHPDRTKGDPTKAEQFQRIGAAYAILSDPEKRQVYDAQGQKGLDMMDQMVNSSGGAMSTEEVAMLVMNQDRLQGVIGMLMCTVPFLILAIIILIPMKMDGSYHHGWHMVMIPVYMMLAIFTLAVCLIRPPENTSMKIRVLWHAKLVKIALFFIFVFLLADKLDSSGTSAKLVSTSLLADPPSSSSAAAAAIPTSGRSYSFMAVFIPLLVWIAVDAMENYWEKQMSKPDEDEESGLLSGGPVQSATSEDTPMMVETESWGNVFGAILYRVPVIVFFILFAQKMDTPSSAMSWWVVYLPLILGLAFFVAYRSYEFKHKIGAYAVHTIKDEEGNDVDIADQQWKNMAACSCCTMLFVLLCAANAASHASGGGFSYVVVFIPIYVVLGLMCFGCCCMVMVVAAHASQDPNAAPGGPGHHD